MSSSIAVAPWSPVPAAMSPVQRPPGEPLRGLVGRALAATPPPALLLFSILMIQIGAALTIDLYTVVAPAALVTLRLAFSGAILLILSRNSLGRQTLAHAGPLMLFGVVIAAMNLAFFEAIARIPLGIAVTIEFVGPLTLAAITSRKPRDFLLVALAAAGVALLAPQIGEALDPVGVALAASAGICWAGFILVAKHTGKHLPGTTGLAIGMALAALLTAPFAVVTGAFATLGPGVLIAALVITVLSQTVPLSLEFAALKRLSSRGYGILVTLEPAAAALVGALVLGQAITGRTLLALALVMTAAIGVTLSDGRGRSS